jgi:hypothetical protein
VKFLEPSVDTNRLRSKAASLKIAIDAFKEAHRDVMFLSTYRPLETAIDDALNGRVLEPRDIGLARWELESNVRDLPEVSDLLVQFELLLGGWALPSDHDAHHPAAEDKGAGSDGH